MFEISQAVAYLVLLVPDASRTAPERSASLSHRTLPGACHLGLGFILCWGSESCCWTSVTRFASQRRVLCVPQAKRGLSGSSPSLLFFFGLVAGDAFVISDLDPTFLSSCCWTQGEGTYLYAAGFWIAVHVGGCCDSLGLVAFPSLVRDTHGKPCIHHWRSPSQ